ncbi:MAG: tRNA 4-thiouridine(8) synthase ThiI [Spirochaetaceae bacterium]|jgi:thiamine biosynthesis protein ThiI|nr:tRNA 4-thiouridine(8) synthase ThiI [Spirochaetaceae bacterium]
MIRADHTQDESFLTARCLATPRTAAGEPPANEEVTTKTYLLKTGELVLKRGNRAMFEKILFRNLAAMLKGSGAQIICKDGRFFVRCRESACAAVEDVLPRLAGITGWAAARVTGKDKNALLQICVDEALFCFERGARSFKIETRRTDKSFPLSSYEINCAAGDAITAALPSFKVDVHTPDAVISVEIREKTFVYSNANKGLRGLPAGTAGRGMLLLSGGIDSPVAGFLMALRGMSLSAVYFHAYPYTPDEAKQKVITLAALLRRYTINLRLFVVSFTAIEQRIKTAAPPQWGTVLLRMAMMECASALALRNKCKCLITGESLAQVASQTVENIACTESKAAFPVFRPLIGMDKEEITQKSIKIGTYQTSILQYADCCTLFSPEHPILHADLSEALSIYDSLDLAELLKTALDTCETIKS